MSARKTRLDARQSDSGLSRGEGSGVPQHVRPEGKAKGISRTTASTPESEVACVQGYGTRRRSPPLLAVSASLHSSMEDWAFIACR